MTNNYQVTTTTQTTPSQVDNKNKQKADGKSVIDLTVKEYYNQSNANYATAKAIMDSD